MSTFKGLGYVAYIASTFTDFKPPAGRTNGRFLLAMPSSIGVISTGLRGGQKRRGEGILQRQTPSSLAGIPLK
jgi:hypothetical protein